MAHTGSLWRCSRHPSCHTAHCRNGAPFFASLWRKCCRPRHAVARTAFVALARRIDTGRDPKESHGLAHSLGTLFRGYTLGACSTTPVFHVLFLRHAQCEAHPPNHQLLGAIIAPLCPRRGLATHVWCADCFPHRLVFSPIHAARRTHRPDRICRTGCAHRASHGPGGTRASHRMGQPQKTTVGSLTHKVTLRFPFSPSTPHFAQASGHSLLTNKRVP